MQAWAGPLALVIFGIAYLFLIAEERLQLRKSVPMLIAGTIIWIVIAIANALEGRSPETAREVERTILEFAGLFLFLVVAMTYINTIEERGVFDALRGWLGRRGLSPRGLFWSTGALAFVISPLADNLTTALVVGAITIAAGRGAPRFTALACINIVVAANAGGVFSPFGDVTTLLVWQMGMVPFGGFFFLLIPSLINWLVPALLMSWAIGGEKFGAAESGGRGLQAGGIGVVGLFLATIGLTVVGHAMLDLPPAVGMTLGLGLLKAYSYIFNRRARRPALRVDLGDEVLAGAMDAGEMGGRADPLARTAAQAAAAPAPPIDVFRHLERVEWDTLLFFYGVILAVGGLETLGYLSLASHLLYGGLGPTVTHVLIGLVSAVVDNVPVMYAVLAMNQPLSQGEWLLVTLTTGVGGSLLSIGSAAGVALMGQARGTYTFWSHLRWSWAIALGYIASIGAHLLLNRALF
ncbi:MAG TPA: sodium:proton antiporter NhaD [Chloroflexota bacterium]|nr:sodium:proton antiporter NhaD [Chloroflexota bacterium]